MDISLEIRKLLPGHVKELSQILDLNESWKKLMSIIPRTLERENFVCNISRQNTHKYHSEHFKLLENASNKMHKTCTELLFNEWGTSGRVRPSLGHLLYLLTKAELYRAADYIAVTLLNMSPPARPSEGPAAAVPTNLPDPCMQEVERILDAMNYPSSVISNLMNTNSDEVDVNINLSTMGKSIPKIIISEPESSIPTIRETQRSRYNKSVAPQSVETIKSGTTRSVSDSDNGALPNLSDIMNSNASNATETTQVFSETCLPDLSELNVSNDGIEAPELQANVPALSTLLKSQNLPELSALLDDKQKGVGMDTGRNSSDPTMSEGFLPDVSILNLETKEQEEAIPNISILIDKTEEHSVTDINSISADAKSEQNISIPQLSALLMNTSLDSGFLPITVNSNASETSSYLSNSSDISQHSDLSRNSRNTCASPLPILNLNTPLPHFPYYEIENATNNFDAKPHKNCKQVENSLIETNGRFLGSGAFGSVFLGLGIGDKPVAVKKLFLSNMDVVNVDDPVTQQFKNEVEVLSKYKHENLLSLIGYSCDGPTYCLLYEFIPGGALKDRLQNVDEKLIWTDRLYIALGTSRAVSYLHTAYGDTPLIHRDIKTANILLDCTNKPKLCDFGLIKLLANQNANTTTSAFGTSAYMAREAFGGHVSVKLDTYSFGVVLLELITGLPPLDENREGCDIVTHVEAICEDDYIAPLVDTKAGQWISKDINFAEELYKISIKCLEQNQKKRPTMVDVTKQLTELIKQCA